MREEKGDVVRMPSHVEVVQESSFSCKSVLDSLFIKRKPHMSTAFMSIKMGKHLGSEVDLSILIVAGTKFFIDYGLVIQSEKL